jgi:biopolymer transport protein ExbD
MIRRRGRGAAREADEGDVNMSPLIDMSFLLLIFFVVTSSFRSELELAIERPGAPQTATASSPKALRVQLDARGTSHVDGVQVQPWLLEQRVREWLERGRVDEVLVVADKHVQASRLVEVVDQCRMAGARHVAVAVDAGSGGESK